MKSLGTILVIGGVMSGVIGGCSSDEGGDRTPGTGGKGGHAGAGKSGSSSGGKSGGSGGKAMSTGGKSGAGSGGKAGSSSGGDGGACLEEVSEHPLAASCDFTNGDGFSTPDTTCTFEDTCEALGCGEPFGMLDASGCVRKECGSSDDCSSGERCVPSVLHGNDCYSSVIEGCTVECDRCVCSVSEDCRKVAYCLPAADYPSSSDCELSGMSCSALRSLLDDLEFTDYYEGDTGAAVAACRAKLAGRIAECDGVAGNGGGGAGGAGAGGEAGHGGQSGHGGA